MAVLQILELRAEDREVIQVRLVKGKQNERDRLVTQDTWLGALSDNVSRANDAAYQALRIPEPFLRRSTALALYPTRLLCGEAGALKMFDPYR